MLPRVIWPVIVVLLRAASSEANVVSNRSAYYRYVSENDVNFNFNQPDPDLFRNVSQLISSKGYPVEEHTVVTEDSYILGIQRITGGQAEGLQEETRIISLDQILNSPMTTQTPSTTAAPSGTKVVLLHHGLLNSAADWVINEVNQSLGYILADNGYDVWLANARGNTYSRNHKTLKSTDKEFWNFSWDEMAAYDLPATIDYILQVTGAEQIHYVGHSMGTTIAFALLSMQPEYNDKVAIPEVR